MSASYSGADGASAQAPMYTCASCMQVQPIQPTGEVLCRYCSHQTTSSKVFFKVRTEPTIYDTR